MGRQLFRTTIKHRLVPTTTDEVIAAMPIPKGGMLTNVWGDVQLVSATNPNRDLAVMYGCHGFIVPFIDDDESLSLDTLWDRVIPKDVDIDTTAGVRDVDIDPETAIAQPVEEPGETNPNRIFNIGNVAERIYNREKILSVASRGLPEFVGSSEDDLWMPTDHFKVRDKKRYKVDTTSYAMFAISSPTLDDMTQTGETTFNSDQLIMYENMELAMQLAMPDIVGMTVTGAASPFGEMAELIELLVEPTVEEETVGAFAAVSYNVFSRFTFEIQFGPEGLSGPIAG